MPPITAAELITALPQGHPAHTLDLRHADLQGADLLGTPSQS